VQEFSPLYKEKSKVIVLYRVLLFSNNLDMFKPRSVCRMSISLENRIVITRNKRE
jgi:hypothetical protein